MKILETLSLYKMKYTQHQQWSQSWNKQQFQLWFYSPLISDCIKMCRWLYASCTWWSSTKMELQEWNIKCQYSSFVLLPLIIKSVLTTVGELWDEIKILTNFISCSEWMLRLAGWIKAYICNLCKITKGITNYVCEKSMQNQWVLYRTRKQKKTHKMILI